MHTFLLLMDVACAVHALDQSRILYVNNRLHTARFIRDSLNGN